MYIGSDGIDRLDDDPTRDAERILENFLAQWQKEKMANALQTAHGEADLLPRLAKIYNVMANSTDMRAVIGQILDACVESVPADRVMLLLRNQDGKLNISLTRGLGTTDQLLQNHRAVIQQVMRNKEPHELPVEEGRPPESTCRKWFFPIIADKNLSGILYVEGKPQKEGQHLAIAQLFSELIALALHHSQLVQGKQLLAGYLKNMQERVLHYDRLALRGRLAAPVGHELNNLLTVISGNIELAKSWMQNSEKREEIDARFDLLQSVIAHASQLAQGLVSHAEQNSQYIRCSLTILTHEIIELLKPIYSRRGAQINFQFSDKVPDILACPGQIRQILHNLLLNTLEARADVEINVSALLDEQAQRVKLFISNQGVGLDKKDVQVLSATSFTGSESGIGLGLLICRQIVEEHGGSLSVDTEPGKGCTYVISLPRYGAERQLYFRKKINREE